MCVIAPMSVISNGDQTAEQPSVWQQVRRPAGQSESQTAGLCQSVQVISASVVSSRIACPDPKPPQWFSLKNTSKIFNMIARLHIGCFLHSLNYLALRSRCCSVESRGFHLQRDLLTVDTGNTQCGWFLSNQAEQIVLGNCGKCHNKKRLQYWGFQLWHRLLFHCRASEAPSKVFPAEASGLRESFVSWYSHIMRLAF